MPELRQNLILKEWVIISSERDQRPDDLRKKKDRRKESGIKNYDENCPLCAGNEEKSGNDETLLEEKEGDRWSIRVIPNKYPALSGFLGSDSGIIGGDAFRTIEGSGRHEVVIESPFHHELFSEMSEEKIARILHVFQKRIVDLYRQPYIESVIVFRNFGEKAGASLRHPHSQLMGMPVIPPDIMARLNQSLMYYEENRKCVFCRVLESELEAEKRIVVHSDSFVSFVPFAAKSPFRLWIFPKNHLSSFQNTPEQDINDLAFVLKQSMQLIDRALNRPDYNLIIRTAPKGYEHSPSFHWYMTVIPRMTHIAGFELGAGMYINSSLPESDAACLNSYKTGDQ